MSLTRTSPSALLLLGLPLATGFGTIARTGSNLQVETAGGGGFFPDPALFPEDACQHLTDGTIKIITEDNEWCGAYKSQDDCASAAGPFRLKLAKSKLSTTGSGVVYDICAWNPDWNNGAGGCRLASMSYFCHNSCVGTPTDRARSTSSAVQIQTSTTKLNIPAVGGVYGEFGRAVVEVYEQTLVYGGRRLSVSDPLKIEKKEITKRRRKMQEESECTLMEDGGRCCEVYEALTDPFYEQTIDPEQNVITVGSRATPTQEPLEGLAFAQFQTCTYTPPSTCECSVANGEPTATDLCATGPPFTWGSQGRRRLFRKRAERDA